ncbi:MAG: DUF4845 domain-containing protein [Pseudomonadota bacterium]
MNQPNMRKYGVATRQRGMTTAGLIIMITFVGLFVYAGLRLTPAYLENYKVKNTIAAIEEEFSGTNAARREIIQAIEKRWNIESINVISWKDVKVVKAANGWDVQANYVNTVPFIANIDFALTFRNEVLVVK